LKCGNKRKRRKQGVRGWRRGGEAANVLNWKC